MPWPRRAAKAARYRELAADYRVRWGLQAASLTGHIERKTTFLLYGESGLGEKPAAMLVETGILIVDAKKLVGYEMPSRL